MSQVLERVEEIRGRCAALERRNGTVSANGTVSGLKSRNTTANGTNDIQAAIAEAAARHELDPAVLTALVQVESGFRTNAVSPDGALGIAQLMPETARALGVADPFDLRGGLEGGAKYLKEQLGRFSGDLALALAAYNAGPAAVARYGSIPPYPETQRFVSRVLDLARRYAGQ
jgi:soluble lytic murein transglycosylase-like protein